MKVLDLQCAHGHGFEGWFASAEAFEAQRTAGLVECPICADTAIVKLLSAPRLNLSGATSAPAAPASERTLAVDSPEARWMRAARELMARTEDVGERFAEEARRMHYGETEERGIRGLASAEEAEALREEGVSFVGFAVPAALKGSAH
ncbi:MAG: DUF1178 family protein [Variovorax sp.]